MDNQMMGGKEKGMICDCGHHWWFGAIVILFGLLFLLEAFGVYGAEITDVAWPILVVVGGGIMVADRKCGCC